MTLLDTTSTTSNENELRSTIDHLNTKEELSVKEAQELAGKLMWLNYSVARTPLASRPHTLNLLRLLPDQTSTFAISPELKQELREWYSDIDKPFTGQPPSHDKPKDLWTDATPTRLAVVFDNTVFIAQTAPEGHRNHGSIGRSMGDNRLGTKGKSFHRQPTSGLRYCKRTL